MVNALSEKGVAVDLVPGAGKERLVVREWNFGVVGGSDAGGVGTIGSAGAITCTDSLEGVFNLSSRVWSTSLYPA